jgi:polyisoprenoid-binding protein YceI
MKKVTMFSAFLLVLAVGFAAFTGPVESFKVDTKESVIEWIGYKVTGKHNGTIQIKNGDLTFENGMLTGGSFDINMPTIQVLDLEGDWKAKLEGHLKSDDFFGVEKFPVSNFKITNVISRGTPGDYKIVGDLTIKETTKEIKFLAKVKEEGNQLKATAEVQIDRSDFNVRYGSGSFFDNLGDNTIYDEFDLTINLVVNK